MDLLDTLTLLIFFASGVYLGWKACAIWMLALFKQVLQDLGVKPEQMEQLTKNNQLLSQDESSDESIDDLAGYPKVAIKIERHGEVLYAFSKDTDEFLGQGDSKESLIARLGEKFTNVTLTIAEEDGSSFVGGRYSFDCQTKEVKKD